MLITSQDVITKFQISNKAKLNATRLDDYVLVGLQKLKMWVGETVWNDINLPDDGTEKTSDLARKKIMQGAACYLTMYFALPNLHTYLTENGSVTTAKDEGNTVLQYLSPEKSAIKRQEYFYTAKEMVGLYVAVADEADDGKVDGDPLPQVFSVSIPTQVRW